MRFIVTDKRAITMASFEGELRQINPGYTITGVITGPREAGSLMLGDDLYGQIEINARGDGLFEKEIKEFLEGLRTRKGKGKRAVSQALKSAKTILAIQVLFQNRETEETLAVINPIWRHLFASHQGILQVDAEGYYDQTDLILGVEED